MRAEVCRCDTETYAKGLCHPCYHRDLRRKHREGLPVRRSHGMKGITEYKIWCGVVQRCTNPNNPRYSTYKGKLCDEWRDFTAFYRDMGNRPSAKHSLDRIDNGGRYEPGNCRWATAIEQARNKVGRSVTHCPSGHEYTQENTYTSPSRGERRCRQCARDRSKKQYWKNKEKA